MVFLEEDINYITIDSFKGHTMQDLIEKIKESDLITFGIAEKIEDETVTLGEYEPIFTLYSDTDKVSDELAIECQLYVSDARKYYEGIVDVGLLHRTIRDLAAQRQLSVQKDDDEPAFYNTYVYFELNISRKESVESFLNRLKDEATKIYFDGKRKAVDVQIQTLQEYKKTI